MGLDVSDGADGVAQDGQSVALLIISRTAFVFHFTASPHLAWHCCCSVALHLFFFPFPQLLLYAFFVAALMTK